jgi:hypothetical protein
MMPDVTISPASMRHNASSAILVFVTTWYTPATAFEFTLDGLRAARPVSAGSVPAGRGQHAAKPLLTFVNNIVCNYYAP